MTKPDAKYPSIPPCPVCLEPYPGSQNCPPGKRWCTKTYHCRKYDAHDGPCSVSKYTHEEL